MAALARFQRTLTDTTGNVRNGVSVTIRDESTGAVAPLYSDKAGTVAITNPVTTDSNGFFAFYVAPGRYRIQATGIDWRDEDLVTVEGLQDAVDEAEAARDAARDARDAAQLSSGIFADTTAGLAGTSEGDYFSTPSGDSNEFLILYRHDSGPVATQIAVYPSLSGIQATDLTNNPVDSTTGAGQALGGALDERGIWVSDLAALKALTLADLVANMKATITTTGRAGDFTWQAGDQSSTLVLSTVASSSVNDTTDTVTATAHGLETGDGVAVSASVNGLDSDSVYWVIKTDNDNFQLAASYSDAQAGTQVDLTGTTNFTTYELLDPLEGVYVTLNGDRRGVNGTFERLLAGFVTPYMFGAQGDGVTDDIAALVAARDSHSNIYFDHGEFLISHVFRMFGPGKRFLGAGFRRNGRGTIIKASGTFPGAIVTTLKEGDTGFSESAAMEVGHFTVGGDAETAVAFVQNTTPNVHDINLSQVNVTYGFTFEGTYGGTYSRLLTNGTNISRAPFGIFRVCLNTKFQSLYSSNLSEFSFEIDSKKTLYSLTTSTGWRENVLDNPTAQGASKYGFYIASAPRKLTINSFYAENVRSTFYIADAREMMVNNGTLYANANDEHSLWIGGVSDIATNISFNNVTSTDEIVFGNCRQVSFNDCKPEFSDTPSSFTNYFERTADLTSNNEIRAILGKSEFRSNDDSSYTMGELKFGLSALIYDGNSVAIPLTSQTNFL